MNTRSGEAITELPGLSLRELLPLAKPFGATDLLVRSCCGNWRDCRPRDLFVAIEEAQEDGHDFAYHAIARGATAVVSERLLAVDAPQFVVEDSRIAYGTVCHALSGNPSDQLRVVGVAGTDGKTVTGLLVRSILKQAGIQVATATSIPTRDELWASQEAVIPANSPSLAHWLANAAAARNSHAVLEISSLSLAQHALAGMSLDVAVLGNIRRDHLAFHGTEQNYRDVQSRLLQYLKSDGTVVLNADDPHANRLLDRLDYPALTIGIHQPAEIHAQLLDREAGRQTFLLTAGGDTAVVSTEMIGKHHVYNCLTAAAVGLAIGIDLPVIVAGLEALGQLPHRLERLPGGHFSVWLDSGRRGSQLAAAIQTVVQETSGRVIVVATVPDDGHDEQRKRLGQLLERTADHVILTQAYQGPCCDYEPFHQVLDGCERPESFSLVPNRRRAIHWALQHARPGDSVLIAGEGHCLADDSTDAVLMSDREVSLHWLAATTPGEHPTWWDGDAFPAEG